jgi:hypothetical protein
MTKHPTCEQKDALISYLYEDGDAGGRARFEAHLAECGVCRAELETLRALRIGLAAWTPPERDLGFTIVSRAEPATAARRWSMPAWGWAAAAALVLATSAAVANLEVRYGADGVTVRTSLFGEREALPGRSSETGGSREVAAARETVAAEAPWRAELTALERRLRGELSDDRASVSSRRRPSTSLEPRAESADLLRRVQELIAASEGRQQRELALRVAQVVRDFDRQRQTDLVQIQRGLGQIEGSAAENREVLNYLVRVSQQR